MDMTTIRTIQEAFINLQYRGFTIASCLAQHKKIDALNTVLTLGAKVEDAIYGAALAGDVELVNHYLGEQPIPSYISSAVRGYARAGHFDAIYGLPDYKVYLKERVYGASQGGLTREVENWVTKQYSLLSSAVGGFVDANDPSTLMDLIKGTCHYNSAIYHAARSGSTVLVEKLLAACGVKENPESFSTRGALEQEAQLSARSYLNQAANGFAAGCHYKEAALMLERGADCSLCLSEITKYSSLEPFFVLYSSVQNEEIAANLLEQMQGLLSVNDIKIPSERLKEIQGVKELMSSEGINYLAAKNKIEGGSEPLLGEKNITLPFLLKVLSQELGFKLDFDVQHDLGQPITHAP